MCDCVYNFIIIAISVVITSNTVQEICCFLVICLHVLVWTMSILFGLFLVYYCCYVMSYKTVSYCRFRITIYIIISVKFPWTYCDYVEKDEF